MNKIRCALDEKNFFTWLEEFKNTAFKQFASEISMLNPERHDCNPRNPDIGRRAKAQNRLHQIK